MLATFCKKMHDGIIVKFQDVKMQFTDPDFVKSILKQFGSCGLEVGLVSPTPTAMMKSIMDATGSFRYFLETKDIHNFSTQSQGQDHRRLLNGYYVTEQALIPTKISLYRPLTKNGDPRVWFYDLARYANPNDLLALIKVDSSLYIINTSNYALMSGFLNPTTPLGSLTLSSFNSISDVAVELLAKLKAISSRGFIKTGTAGDTGIGSTLESLLGIRANSSKAPDYQGIEIKASRQSPRGRAAATRVNLFSQVPNWNNPSTITARNMLANYGYQREGRQQLYCSVDALRVNSQALQLRIDNSADTVAVCDVGAGNTKPLLVWDVNLLRLRLAEKHPESFWVKATSKIIEGVEHFYYHTVIHTRAPLLANLTSAIQDGIISLDLTMSDSGQGAVRDHGYLFKIWPDDFSALFPSIKEHSLVTIANKS